MINRKLSFKHQLATLLLLACTGAIADADSAAAAYFNNLAKWHYDISARASTIVSSDTLVRGVYRLEDRASGRFIAMITERGDLKGDSTGWSVVGKDGPEELNDVQLRQLRREVMRNVRWDGFIRVRYGNGGARRLILISAVNCPYCRNMEANLQRSEATLQTTFYVLPSSLTPLDQDGEGQRTWRQAVALWCARDDGASWKKFWITRELPVDSACPLDTAAAQKLFRNFGTVMASIGARVRGTPALIREDGGVIGVPLDFDSKYASSTYGPAGKPADQAAPSDAELAIWLTPPR